MTFSERLFSNNWHGDLSRPQSGPQGRSKSERLWVELTNTLNSLGGGVQKSSDKWKKVWADWKTKTKKKYLTIRKHASGTGGGPSNRIPLSVLEERVVAIIGISAVVGQAGIEEQGFNTTSNEPALVGSGIQLPVEQNSALGDNSQNLLNISNFADGTPGTSGICRTVTNASTLIIPSSPPPLTSSPPPLTSPSPPRIRPPPREQRRPRTPPLRRNRQQAGDSPLSTATTPRRALLSARRNRGLTPFERAAQEFAAVEQRRLAREEAREMRRLELEEERDKRLHEREMERVRLEAQKIEVAQQHNQLLHQLGILVQSLIDVISQQRQINLPSTDPR